MMLTLDDLQTVCPKCKGAGFVQDWQWIQWWEENVDVPPPGHPLLQIHEEIPCEECDELGYIPTEQGKTLLIFLNHFRGRR
jgi:hypothetical protein